VRQSENASVLETWGWNASWMATLRAATPDADEAVRRLGRVSGQERDRVVVQCAEGSTVVRVKPGVDGQTVVTGDWVVLEPGYRTQEPATVEVVLPRRTALARGRPGDGLAAQVLAANLDVVWIVQPLDADINVRRIERSLAVAWESGAVPELVLTKADLYPDEGGIRAALGTVAMGIAMHFVSLHQPASVDVLRRGLSAGSTVVLLGPSGAGKSSLINALAGAELAETGPVRASDGKGRHTTTRRELFVLPGGALLLDTPGVRELRLWALDDGLDHTFPEIAALAASCRFRDCQHETEPGCAVLEAVADGRIDATRMASYQKLKAEAAYVHRSTDREAQAAAVARHKTAMKTLKFHPKYQGGRGG
jgi:ribosome biogenesis GTPase / thiamine phosphate phosphatase